MSLQVSIRDDSSVNEDTEGFSQKWGFSPFSFRSPEGSHYVYLLFKKLPLCVGKNDNKP